MNHLSTGQDKTAVSLAAATAPHAELVIQGTGAALGHAIEKALVIGHGTTGKDVPLKFIEAGVVPIALDQFTKAIETGKSRLTQEIAQASNREQGQILDVQVQMLNDPMVISEVKSFIQDGIPVKKLPPGTTIPEGAQRVRLDPTSAVSIAMNRYVEVLRSLDDPEFAARASDAEAARDLIISLLAGGSIAIDAIHAIKERCIVVAEKLSPGQAAAIKKEFVVGIVTSNGSKNDHVAVIAKSLGIPLVVGADISGIETGATILVDGDRGLVLVNPAANSIAATKAEIETIARTKRKLPISTRAPKTKDGEDIILAATMDTTEQQGEILSLRAQGVGLFRTEFMHLGKNQILGEDEQFEQYSAILRAFSPNPVVFRIMDLGADKVMISTDQHVEANPALGARGIRLALHKDQVDKILIPQIRAILRASVFGEARILIPMVNNVGEIAAVRQIIAAQSAKLAAEGFKHDPSIKVGAMIETPAAAMGAYRIFHAVDFANVGSNDMTQYTLALDRENPLVEHHYQPHDPALVEIYRTIVRANIAEARDSERNRRPLLVCGDASSNPLLLPVFIGLGYRGFSVPPPAIEELNYRLSLLDSVRCKLMVEKLRDAKTGPATADEVKAYLNKFQDSLQLQ